MDTFFLAKMTLKNRYEFWGLSGTPLSKPNTSTPLDFSLPSSVGILQKKLADALSKAPKK